MIPSKPMRIGYVVKRYPRYSETFIVNEILAHEAAGTDIHIFALRPPEDTHFQDKISQVRAPVTYLRKPTQGRVTSSLITLSPTPASYFWAELQETASVIPDIWTKLEYAIGERSSVVYQAVWLAQEIRRREITHLHAHFGTVATNVARLAAYFAGVPYTFTAHAKDIFHESVNPEDLRRKLRAASTVVTVSDYSVAYLQEQFGQDARKVQRIYNGMDLSELQFRLPTQRAPKILSVCRLVEKKGLSYLIDACAMLRQWGCEFTCQIVGTGNLGRDLRSQIQALNLDDWIELIGPRPQREVFELMQNAAVFAAPYIIGKDGNRDGLPTALLEAMALGTPCVATDVTGIPEIIQDGETGLQVAQRDVTTLAQALQKLLTSSTLRERVASQARELVETEFDITQNAAVLRTLFQHHNQAVKAY
ncbi:group 1 glycosyl transferase [Leptolyngbya sp. Heron Island J]|uniref:glycosyltransferase family 4 protein n=1 Tax=Leptolyngbya sp. Heron Island J TaxID=1385935 RepID=UPI0003B95386|nr:glycosyltransferase family 4 protein [Leptolyngbya sp. Heron Island J]ESA33377.1 group 1 glycosyl transferase [Leptolyngbya sp. Heron Island J]